MNPHTFVRSVGRLILLAFAAIPLLARADEWAPNLTALATWHSNASQANRSVDELDSLQLSADVLASKRYLITRDDSVNLTGHVAAEWWPRYSGLTQGTAGARAEGRHQFGADPLAPEVAVEGFVDALEAKESARRGFAFGATVSARKRLNERTRVLAWHQVSWMDARAGTFDAGASESALEIQYDLTAMTRLALTGRFRDGDIVTYATGVRPDLEALATNRRDVETFDRSMTAYRVDAKTWGGRLALYRALDNTTAITLAYEIRQSERDSFKFTDHLLSVGFVHQF